MSDDAYTQAAAFQWDDGLRRLEACARDASAPWRERVVAECQDELRRRLGIAFTTDDLAREYRDAATWFLAIAVEQAPGHPEAWDTSVVMDAAFGRFRRQATDFHRGAA